MVELSRNLPDDIITKIWRMAGQHPAACCIDLCKHNKFHLLMLMREKNVESYLLADYHFMRICFTEITLEKSTKKFKEQYPEKFKKYEQEVQIHNEKVYKKKENTQNNKKVYDIFFSKIDKEARQNIEMSLMKQSVKLKRNYKLLHRL